MSPNRRRLLAAVFAVVALGGVLVPSSAEAATPTWTSRLQSIWDAGMTGFKVSGGGASDLTRMPGEAVACGTRRFPYPAAVTSARAIDYHKPRTTRDGYIFSHVRTFPTPALARQFVAAQVAGFECNLRRDPKTSSYKNVRLRTISGRTVRQTFYSVIDQPVGHQDGTRQAEFLILQQLGSTVTSIDVIVDLPHSALPLAMQNRAITVATLGTRYLVAHGSRSYGRYAGSWDGTI